MHAKSVLIKTLNNRDTEKRYAVSHYSSTSTVFSTSAFDSSTSSADVGIYHRIHCAEMFLVFGCVCVMLWPLSILYSLFCISLKLDVIVYG